MWRFLGASDKPCSSLVAQTVKNLPAMQKTWVQSLGQEDPLEKEMAAHSGILAGRIPWTEEPGGLYSPWDCKELDMTKGLTLSLRSLNQVVTVPTPGLRNKLFLLQGTLFERQLHDESWVPTETEPLTMRHFVMMGCKAQHDPVNI